MNSYGFECTDIFMKMELATIQICLSLKFLTLSVHNIMLDKIVILF